MSNFSFLEKLREVLSYEPLQWWHVWVILGVLAAILEMFTTGFVILCVTVGCFAAAVSDCAFAASLRVQIGVFAGSTLVSFFLMRPVLKTWLLKRREETNVDAIVGQTVKVVARCEAGGVGMVRIGAEQWRAEAVDGSSLEVGAQVRVLRVEGNRAIVVRV